MPKNLYKFLYSKRSSYLLNNLTLKIRDPIIRQEYDKRRTERFNSLYYPVLGVEIVNFVLYCIVDSLDSDSQMKSKYLWTLPTVLCLLVWTVFKFTQDQRATVVPMIYIVAWLTTMNLKARGYIPDSLYSGYHQCVTNRV